MISALISTLRELDVAAFALALGLLWMLLVIRNAQAGGFQWKAAMCDADGKESVLRFAVLACLVISSWLLMYITINVVKNSGDLEQLFPFFVAFLAVWSGAKVVEKLIDLLATRWAK